MLFKHVLIQLYLVIFFLAVPAMAGLVLPPVNPDNANGAVEFDWQQSWGTIHMNSLADGLLDPGAPASANGQAPCLKGALCQTMKDPHTSNGANLVIGGSAPRSIDNGIKYDIKNSVLNCMSKMVPNWALLPGRTTTYAQNNVCTSSKKMPPLLSSESAVEHKHLRTMIYLPLWDERSNDERAEDQGQPVGCQQQVTNTCGSARDIHACVDPANGNRIDTKEGYEFPVTHTFSPEEVQDLGGAGKALPTRYYSYLKALTKGSPIVDSLTAPTGQYVDYSEIDDVCPKPGGGTKPCKKYSYTPVISSRQALSRDANPTDAVVGEPIQTINVGSEPNLARIKSYKFENTDSAEDLTSFTIMDPSDFFDLRLYLNKPVGSTDPIVGKYDSNYNQKDASGYVKTYETCPVIGLTSGYSGICDPTGNAGCNLPIYKNGPQTTFTTEDGESFTYNDYPIVWSGYVKKWAIISVDQYKTNVAGREKLYATKPEHINDNPIVMVTRAAEYCDIREMLSDPDKIQQANKAAITGGTTAQIVPNMPCVQYLQYQDISDHVKGASSNYLFVDLFAPEQDPFEGDEPPVEYEEIQLYNLTSTGKPNLDSPVVGTSDDSQDILRQPLMGRTAAGGKVNLLSYGDLRSNPNITYKDAAGNDLAAKKKLIPVINTSGAKTVGMYLGGIDPVTKAQITDKGTGIRLTQGIFRLLRLENEVTLDVSTNCVKLMYEPKNKSQPEFFVPTNSTSELASFLTAVYQGKIPDVLVQACGARFQAKDIAEARLGYPVTAAKDGEPKTWVGKLSCDGLVEKPACNQTKMITAQRFCELENGSLASCGACLGSSDPDSNFIFDKATVKGEIMVNPNSGLSRCYFSAACFNDSAAGCPAANTSGGHVFCLSPDTKILMADGKEKPIKKIKAGDQVMGFNGLFSRGGLSQAKVKATTITKNQPILKVNELKLTPEHKVILASGRAVTARDLKLGDRILLADGSTQKISTIQNQTEKIDVYNLVLADGFDGYIAGGIRVLAYPDLKGLAKN